MTTTTLDWGFAEEAAEKEPQSTALDRDEITAEDLDDLRLDLTIREQADGDEATALSIANRMVGILALLQRRQRLREEFVERERERLDAWLEKQNAEDEKSIEALNDQLHIFAEEEGEKTLELPRGTLRRRARRDRITWDEVPAQEYQREHYPEDMSLSKSALKEKLVKQDDGTFVDPNTGEVVPFVRMVERDGETFSVQVADEE